MRAQKGRIGRSEALFPAPALSLSELWALTQPEHPGADSCPQLGPGSFYTVGHLPYWVTCSLWGCGGREVVTGYLHLSPHTHYPI